MDVGILSVSQTPCPLVSAGAGDTVIGVTASAMAASVPVREAVALANLAAGAICEKVGVQPISVDDIRQTLAFFSAKAEDTKSSLDGGMLPA